MINGAHLPYPDQSVEVPPAEAAGGEAAKRSAQEKWGEKAIERGFQILPDAILLRFHELGISATDFLVLLNITSFWWKPGTMPYPRVATVAKRMGASTRTVQRSLGNLHSAGLIRMVGSQLDGIRRTKFDLEPLKRRAEILAAKGPDGGQPRKVSRKPPGLVQKTRRGTDTPFRHPDPNHFREWEGADTL